MGSVITLADLKADLKVEGVDADRDARLDGIIDAVEGNMQAFLRVPLLAAAQLDVLNVRKHQVAFSLLSGPVSTLSSVHYSTEQVWDSETELGAEDYYWDSRVERLYLKTCPGAARRSLRVSYSAGLATSQATLAQNFPPLVRAALMQCGEEYRRRENPAGQRTVSGAEVTHTGELKLLARVREYLAPYRRVMLT